MIIFQTPLTLTAEYVMNGADLMLPGVATLSGMAEKYTFFLIFIMTTTIYSI